MHLHNVAEYAPPGYRLERSDHEEGVCKHLFVSGGGPDLVCELTAHSAAEERAELQAFQAKHQLAASQNLVSEAAVRASRSGASR